MPFVVIQDEVKRKWNIEVTTSHMYKGRRRAGKQIFGFWVNSTAGCGITVKI